jgi:hypothetical protein
MLRPASLFQGKIDADTQSKLFAYKDRLENWIQEKFDGTSELNGPLSEVENRLQANFLATLFNDDGWFCWVTSQWYGRGVNQREVFSIHLSPVPVIIPYEGHDRYE